MAGNTPDKIVAAPVVTPVAAPVVIKETTTKKETPAKKATPVEKAAPAGKSVDTDADAAKILAEAREQAAQILADAKAKAKVDAKDTDKPQVTMELKAPKATRTIRYHMTWLDGFKIGEVKKGARISDVPSELWDQWIKDGRCNQHQHLVED